MMASADHEGTLRQAIRRSLALRIGAAADAAAVAGSSAVADAPAVADARAVADATIRTWYQVAARLTPVIGLRGFDALFIRALHVTSAIFPWLIEVQGHEGGPAALGFRTCLEARDVEVATEASAALLLTFSRLLIALIGESLAERLLGPVWAPALSLNDQEPKP